MRLDEISVFHVSMPLIDPWKTAFGEMTTVETVLVQVSAEGQVGWGEAAPYALPQFCPEWADGCFRLIADIFRPRLLHQDIGSGEELQARLAPFKGNQFAKAAIDLAWWDLATRLQERPLWRAIGGQDPSVAVGADIPVQRDVKSLLAAVGNALRAGFPRVKLKFHRESGFGTIAAVREAFPDATVHIDCNSGFTLDDIALFHDLDRLGLAMIEQPLASDDLVDHARLQARLVTPLCLDESITSPDKARKAIELDAGRIINIKHGRVGGLTNALRIATFCQEKGVPFWIGGMLESGVGQGASIALATLAGASYPADIFPDGRLYAIDLAEPALFLTSPGKIEAPDRPGCGFLPDMRRLVGGTIARCERGEKIFSAVRS